MNSKKTLIGISLIAIIILVGFIVFANPFKSNIQTFSNSLKVLVSKSGEMTSAYQEEVGKWNNKQYDNLTMVSITDNYLALFDALEQQAANLSVPEGYEDIKNSFIKSLESEASSYDHFKRYLITGNSTEDELSTNKLSLAFQYEQIYSEFLSKNN